MINSVVLNEVFTINIEDVALLTSFADYVTKNEKEPAKVESIGKLKKNLNVLYNKMKSRDLTRCFVSVGKKNKDKIDHTPYRVNKPITKCQAASLVLNQATKERNQSVEIIFSSETDEYHEFVVKGILNGID